MNDETSTIGNIEFLVFFSAGHQKPPFGQKSFSKQMEWRSFT
jgi:hypothetical protein